MAFSEKQYVAPMGDGSFILYWNGKIYPFGNQQDAELAYNEMERTGGASDGAVPRAGTVTPPSGGSGGGITTPPSGGGGTVTPPSGGGSGGGFGVVGGTGQLDAQQWQLQQEYQRMQLAEQRRQHEIDAAQRQREFESRLEQERRQLGLSEQEIAERRRQFDVQQESENRRFESSQAEATRQFNATYGLDERRLGEDKRRFDLNYGLDRDRFGEDIRRFDQSQGLQNEQYWAGLLGSLSGPQNADKFLIAQSQLPAGVQGGSLSDVFNATPSFGAMRAGGPSWEQVWANFQGPRPSLGAGAGGPAPYTPPGGGSGIPGDTMPVNPPGSLPPVRRDEQVSPLVRGGGLGGPGGGIPGDTMPVGGGGAQDWTDGGFWPNTPPFVKGGATTPPTIIPEQGPTGGRGIVPGFGPEPAPRLGQPPALAPEQGPSGQRMPGGRAWDTMRSGYMPAPTAPQQQGRINEPYRAYDPSDRRVQIEPQARQAPWLAMQGQQNGKNQGTGYLGPPVRDDGAPRIGLGGGGPAPRDNSGGTGRPPIGLGGGGPAPRDKGAGTGYLGPPVRDDNGTGSNWTNTPAWKQSINQPINYSRAEYNRMSPYMRKRQESQWSAQSIDPSTAWNTMRQSWNSGGGGSMRTRWR